MVQPPIRVTHVVFDFNGGGLESLVAEMGARFRGSAIHVSLITLSGRIGRLGALTRDRFDHFEVLRPKPGLSMIWPAGVARAIRKTAPDVVHLHSGAWYKPARAARLAGVRRVIFTEHGREHDDPPLRQWLDRRAARYTDVVVAVSDRLARYLVNNVGIDADRVTTIHNGVDTALFAPGPASESLRQRLEIPDGAAVIGSVGRLEPVKAQERLLDAVSQVRDRLGRPIVVVICGDGSRRDALLEHAAKLGIADQLRLPGWLDDPVQAYRLFDVFALPSRSEGQSLSLMEAMACGIPAVVTDVGANAEMLGPDFGAQVVPSEPGAALAEAIVATLTKAESSDEMGSKLRRRALDHYSLDRMVQQYELLYRGSSVPVVPAADA
jgi:glycosyltransferase involved in cell wall biosynthesis